MEQSEEVEDVTLSFTANRRYIGWQAKQLACLLGDPTLTSVNMWCQDIVVPPMDVAQAVQQFADFIKKHPLPKVTPRLRSSALTRAQRITRCEQFATDARIVHLRTKQLARHMECTSGMVQNWLRCAAAPPIDACEVLHLWAQYIQEHPFPQYRKGTHGGARYRRTSRTAGCARVLS